jgi:NAD(P)H-hydrate epimerase
VRAVLASCTVPLILDADALTVLAGDTNALQQARAPLIITPHPGELAALRGGSAADVQSNRPAAAQETAKQTGTMVVLKGAGTLVAQPDGPCWINMTGNPGMATGGTGDVLAGLLTGLVGQGLSPFDAARAAVYVHGRAGDMVAWRKSQAGLVAGDLVEELPYAFRELTLR